jgi:uncharacterized protein
LIEGSLYLSEDHNKPLLRRVMRTCTMFERMRGLLGHPALEQEQGLLIIPCSSIHTFFMHYAIDLVFLNKNWQIKKLISALKPWRMAWGPGAAMVLEMQAGTIVRRGLALESTLVWEEHK